MSKTRTSRMLKLFHIFYYCEEVSLGAVREYIPETMASSKTIHRDIKFLEQAGLIRARYSKASRAYVPTNRTFVRWDEFYPPEWPDSQTKRLYMEKIIRLCTLMRKMIMYEVENPIEWYRERYPELSDRTRQRDFNQLREVEYCVTYEPADDWGPAGYYYNYPGGF